MKISLTNVDSVNAILHINIKKEDYQDQVKKAINSFRKNANMPGFRPGSVPTAMVNKMYGKSIIADEVNKLVGESLYNYIKEEDLNVLGEPISNEEKQEKVDFSKENDYNFYFDVALAPDVKIDISEKDKINYYKVKIDQKLVDEQIDSYKANYGKYEKIEENAKETDLIKGRITELEDGEPKANGIVVEEGVVMPSYMKDKEEQAKFVGTKPGKKLIFNPGKAYEGNTTEISSLLNVKKDSLTTISPEFEFEVKEITRYAEASLGKELYNKVFGEDSNISNKGEFEEKIKEAMSAQFAPDSDYKFILDARELLEKKAGKMEFPEATLKRWLLSTGEDRTEESLEKEFPQIIKDLKFHLIKEQIAKENDLKIENDDVKAIAMQVSRSQFAQYGMMGLPEEMIENHANDLLKNEENARGLVDKAMENKIVACLKSKMKITKKEISMDDFKKIFEAEKSKETEEK